MDDLLESWLNQVLGEELQNNVLPLLDSGMPPEQVAAETGLTVEQVLHLAEEQRAEQQERGTAQS